MMMIIINIPAFFHNSGTPVTGLTPTVWAYDLDTEEVVVNGLEMTELGHGQYTHSFTTTDQLHSFRWTIDGGATLAAGYRYKEGGWQNTPTKSY